MRRTANRARLKTQDSRLKTQDSRLKTQDSRLKTQDSRLKTQDSALEQHVAAEHERGVEIGVSDSGSVLERSVEGDAELEYSLRSVSVVDHAEGEP